MTTGLEPEEPVDRTPVIGESTPRDGALFVATALASLLPIVGGPAATIAAEMRRVMDRRQAERLAATVDDLRSTLDRLGEEVNRDLSADAAFAGFVEAALAAAAQARHADKRRYYVALIARATTDDGPEEVQRAMLLNTLDRVELTHLRLLQAVASGPLPERTSDFGREGTPSYAALQVALPGIGLVFIHRAWEDLVSLGLLASWVDVLVTEDAPVELTTGPLTPFGRAFLDWVSPFSDDLTPTA